MSAVKYKYYGIKGQYSYVHAECWPAYEEENSRYDAQGWTVWRPKIESKLMTFRGIRQARCLHCGRALLAKHP